MTIWDVTEPPELRVTELGSIVTTGGLLTLLGEIETFRRMFPLNPFRLRRLMLLVLLDPALAVSVVGLAVIVKSGGGAVTVTSIVVACTIVPLKAPMVIV